MTVDDYRSVTEGRQVDLDHYPASQPFQCVDEASDYMINVVGGARFTGNAKDIYGQQSNLLTWVKNTPNGVPSKGAVFVYGNTWGAGFGHVGIVLSANVDTVTLLEQNVAAPRVTVGTHRYDGSIGWGIPNKNVNAVLAQDGRYKALRVCNVRVAPRLTAALSGSQVLHPEEWFDASGVTTGDTYNGNNQWVRSLKGNYIWSGNLTKIG